MLKMSLLYFDRTTPTKICRSNASLLGESVLPVLVGDGGEDRAAADDDARADDEGRHLLGEVVLGGALEVVPGTVRLRTIHVCVGWADGVEGCALGGGGGEGEEGGEGTNRTDGGWRGARPSGGALSTYVGEGVDTGQHLGGARNGTRLSACHGDGSASEAKHGC